MAEKSEIEEGCVLWLSIVARGLDRETYHISGLDSGAVDHPVLVLACLGYYPFQYYMVATCTGTYHLRHGDIPIFNHVTSSAFRRVKCNECKQPESATQPLYFIGDIMQPKHTHLNVRNVYLVSQKMIRAQRNTKGVQDCEIDYQSLQIALESATKAIRRFKARAQIKAFLEKYPLPQEITALTDPPPEPISVLSTAVSDLALPKKTLPTKTNFMPESKGMGKAQNTQDAGIQKAQPSAAATPKEAKKIEASTHLVQPGYIKVFVQDYESFGSCNAHDSLKNAVKSLCVVFKVGENESEGQHFVFPVVFITEKFQPVYENLTLEEKSDYLPMGNSQSAPVELCGPRLHVKNEDKWHWGRTQGYVMVKSGQWLPAWAVNPLVREKAGSCCHLTEESLNVLNSKWIDFCSKKALAMKPINLMTALSNENNTEIKNDISGIVEGIEKEKETPQIQQQDQKTVDTKSKIDNSTSETYSTNQSEEASEKRHKRLRQNSKEKVLKVVRDGKCEII